MCIRDRDISDAVDDVQGDMDELNEYVEAIDEDLSDLEEEPVSYTHLDVYKRQM